jgi:hypothetical protein
MLFITKLFFLLLVGATFRLRDVYLHDSHLKAAAAITITSPLPAGIPSPIRRGEKRTIGAQG